MELQADESQAAYRIISFKGEELPKDYKPLVFSRMLRSLRFGNEYFKLIDQDVYFKNYHEALDRLLSRGDILVKFAVLADDHDIVLGYAITAPGTLHWVHVHKDYRKNGICSQLLKEPFDAFTHLTISWASIWSKKYKETKFNPWR